MELYPHLWGTLLRTEVLLHDLLQQLSSVIHKKFCYASCTNSNFFFFSSKGSLVTETMPQQILELQEGMLCLKTKQQKEEQAWGIRQWPEPQAVCQEPNQGSSQGSGQHRRHLLEVCVRTSQLLSAAFPRYAAKVQGVTWKANSQQCNPTAAYFSPFLPPETSGAVRGW